MMNIAFGADEEAAAACVPSFFPSFSRYFTAALRANHIEQQGKAGAILGDGGPLLPQSVRGE